MASLYPNRLDNDATLPAVYDDITEMGGIAIDSLRSAVFNIEKTLGINPQGTANDLVTRLDKSFNSDGTIKGDALLSLGYVILPIINDYIAFNAGIEESKLSLDFSTAQLKTWIDELWDLFWPLSNQENQLIHEMRLHFKVPVEFGKHQTQDIDGYVGHYVGYNLQGIITDLDVRIEAHINDLIAAHAASAIFVDDSRLEFTTSDVQDALEQLDYQISTNLFINHSDDQHGNVISPVNRTFVSGTNRNINVVESSLLKPFSVGSRAVQFHILPSSIGDVSRGDRIDVVVDSVTYSYIIYNTNIVNGFVYFTGSIPVNSDGAYATIYRTEIESSSPSVLKAVIRNKQIIDACGSIVQLIHPSAAFVISDGFDARRISDPSNINIAWEGGETGDVNLYELMLAYNIKPSTWTIDSVIETLNEYFTQDYPFTHFPVIAFESNGELGFALDKPGGYLETKPAISSSVWETLGFVENKKYYSVGPRKLYLDGYEYNTIKTLVDSTGSTNGSTEIINIADDLLVNGVRRNGLVRVTGHSTDNGTFAFNQVYDHKLVVGEHSSNFDADSVGVKIYSDTFSLHFAPPKRTLYELFVQGVVPPEIEFNGAARVEYCNSLWAKNNPEDWFDVIAVSRGFLECERRLFFDGNYNVSLGEISSECTITNPGNVVALPIDNAEGFQFRLYDGGKVNYIDFQVVSAGYIASSVFGKENAVDIFIHDRISEERYLQVGTVLHNKKLFKNFSDRRVIGSVNRKQIGTDFIKDKIYATGEALRANGIVYGFETNGSVSTVIVDGGQALLNGAISIVSTTEFGIPKDNVSTTYNVFIDFDGVLKLLRDNYYEWGVLTTPSLFEIINSNRVMIAQVVVNASNVITSIKDFRKFVNVLDNKLDLTVSSNPETGMFLSLRAAVNYLNAFGESYSGSKRIVIRGTIEHDLSEGTLYLPNNTMLCGELNGSSEIHLSNYVDFIIPGDNCVIENLTISNMGGGGGGGGEYGLALFGAGTSITDSSIVINGLKIINCRFRNLTYRHVINAKELYDCIIENCEVELLSSYLIVVKEKFENIIVRNCNVYGSNSYSRCIRINNGKNINISDNIMSFNYMSEYLVSIVEAENIIVQNNIFNLTTETNTHGVIEFLDNINGLFFDSNKIYFNGNIPASNSDSIIKFSNSEYPGRYCYFGNVNITNNIINAESSSTINRVIAFQTGSSEYEYDIVSANIINNTIDVGKIRNVIKMWSTQSIRDIKIDCNSISFVEFLDFTDAFIVPYTIMNAVISSHSSGKSEDVFIDGNYFYNKYDSAVSNAYGCFIHIDSSGDDLIGNPAVIEGSNVNINNNIFKNENLFSCAKYGIFISTTKHKDVRVQNNCFYNFIGDPTVDSKTAKVIMRIAGQELYYFSINSNIFSNCLFVATAGYVYNFYFEDNIVNNTVDLTTGIFNTSGTGGLFIYSMAYEDTIIRNNTIYNAIGGTIGSYGPSFIKALYSWSDFETNFIIENNHIINTSSFGTNFNIVFFNFTSGSVTAQPTNININNNTIDVLSCNNVFWIAKSVTHSSMELEQANLSIFNNYFIGSVKKFIYGTKLWLSPCICDNIVINNNNSAIYILDTCIETTDGVYKRVIIKNNIVTNANPTFGFGKAISLTQLVSSSYVVDFIQIENNMFNNFDNASSGCIYIYNQTDNVSLSGNKFINCKYSVYLQNPSIVADTGNYYICNNIIENIGLGTSSIIKFDNVDKNVLISGNIINTDSVNTNIIYLNGVSGNINICNNSITSSESEQYMIRVYNSGEVKNVTITDNELNVNNSTSNIIYIYGSGIFNTIIKNNLIYVEETTGGCIYLQALTTGINNCVFVKNSIFCNNSSSLVTKSALLSKGANNNIIIANNEFINLNMTKGFENCIYLDDSAKNVVILNNIILNFDYDSVPSRGTAIQFENAENIIISKNTISAVHALASAVGDENKDIIFYGNYCINTTGKMVIAFNNADLYNISIISNHFINTSVSMTGTFVSILSTAGLNCIINNNVFISNHISSSLYYMLKVQIDSNCFVCNNIFGGDNIVFSLTPIHITTSDASDICAFNNLRTCFRSSGMGGDLISVTGSNYCNFGEHYIYNVPLSSFTKPKSLSSSAPVSWRFFENSYPSITQEYIFQSSYLYYPSSYPYLTCSVSFGTENTYITKVNVAYRFDTADLSQVNFSWCKKETIQGELINLTDPPLEFTVANVYNVESIVDLTGYIVVGPINSAEEHIFTFTVVGSGFLLFALAGLSIDYVL